MRMKHPWGALRCDGQAGWPVVRSYPMRGILRRFRSYGSLAAGELPGTLRRSCQEAQAMFLEAREEAVRVHGEGDEAYRAAFAALKRKFEKCGDHWIAKAEPAA